MIIPVNCPSCKTILEIKNKHLICTNPTCKEQQIQKIIYYCKKSDMENFSEASIRTLYNEEVVSSIIELYTLNWDNVESIDGFGKKKVKKIKEEIKKSKNCNIQEFVSRLSIPLVGIKAMKKLEINTVKEFWAFRNTQYVIGQNLHDYKLENTVFISFLMKELLVTDIKETKGDDRPKVAMTGKYDKMNRKELISLIEQIGNEFVSSVTKDTDILICADVNGTSSKLVKAKKNGIKLISYEEFFKTGE